MHLLTNYSSKLLCKIDQPSILTKFYPTPEKYITINCAGAMAAKSYDYWSIVLDFICPELQKNNIQIVQLGDKNEPVLKNVLRLAGQTDIHQSAHIVKNSLLHVGTDSFLIHAAGGFDVPIVGLYSVSPPSICGSYFGDKNKQTNLEPNFKENQSYSYNPQEPNKVINSIKPEQIVEAIGKLLNIQFPKFETIFIGGKFTETRNELIPNSLLNPQMFPNSLVHLRADYLPEINDNILQLIYNNIASRPCSLRINKPININPLITHPQLKKNLAGIVLDIIDDSFSEEFVKSLLDNQIKFILAYGGADEEFLKKQKLKLCEFGIIQRYENENSKLKEILNSPDFDPSNVYIKSNKILVGDNGEIFSTRAAHLDNLSAQKVQSLDVPLKTLRGFRETLPLDGDHVFLFRYL